jgi:beta-glucanase (GH16 family)
MKTNNIQLNFLFFAILLALLPSRLIASNDGYTLVWNEDFTDATLDRNVWNIEVNGDGGGNNELQYYCEKGVTLDVEPTTGKRCLVLTATKEDYKGKKCTSGRVNSKNNLYYTYGKIEARIKFPNTANGLWPAFWQMGNDYGQVGWPRCGETDIIELGNANGIKNGTQDRYFNGALHLGSAWNTVWSDAQSTTHPYSVEDTFHIITMEWTPTSITMYMDKDAHPELEPYFYAKLEGNDDANYNRELVFGKPNFIIANLAVGGNFPGIHNISGITALANESRSMYIDWIRIYQQGTDKETFVSPSPSDDIEPEEGTGLEDVLVHQSAQKMIINGQIYIRKNNELYNIVGQKIK